MNRFGSPFDFGYDWSETIRVMPPRVFAPAEIPRGLVVLLFAPGKSLFLWAPILVIAALNASATWRRDRALAIGLATGAISGLLVYAAYLFPEGGYAHGPRHLVPLIPLLALAAAGIYALEHHVARLADDHANARRLAEGLEKLGVRVEPAPETNIVLFRVPDAAGFLREARRRGVLVGAIDADQLRAVTHLDVARDDVEEALGRIEEGLRALRA